MNSVSIHPRVVGGTTVHPKVNTCGRSTTTRRVHYKMIARYDRRTRGWETTTRSVGAKQEAGYKRPGSRNPRKLRKR